MSNTQFLVIFVIYKTPVYYWALLCKVWPICGPWFRKILDPSLSTGVHHLTNYVFFLLSVYTQNTIVPSGTQQLLCLRAHTSFYLKSAKESPVIHYVIECVRVCVYLF